jgi:hypothetical protein
MRCTAAAAWTLRLFGALAAAAAADVEWLLALKGMPPAAARQCRAPEERPQMPDRKQLPCHARSAQPDSRMNRHLPAEARMHIFHPCSPVDVAYHFTSCSTASAQRLDHETQSGRPHSLILKVKDMHPSLGMQGQQMRGQQDPARL